MDNIIIAFVTGLTTGGLSCLAVQGGLLASSLAGQIEKNFQQPKNNLQLDKNNQNGNQADLGMPIVAFLVSKIIAYTILGSLLGMIGQAFQLSPLTRAVLQIGIGIFMLGTALRMFNVHPIFRYFTFEPPAFLRRKLRQSAKNMNNSSLASPILLGFLTVLIPCGVTQAMMAAALGSGDPIQGAALMFAFTLGTSPVFFAVSYFASKLGEKLEKYFLRFTAVVILILAVITIDTGVTLFGSPFSLSRLANRLFSPTSVVAASLSVGQNGVAVVATPVSEILNGGNHITLPAESLEDEYTIVVKVLNNGYSPDVTHAKAGVPITLQLVSEGVQSCSRAFIIPSLGVQMILPATGVKTVDIPPQEKGAEIPYSCSMGMYSGTIIFDLEG